MRVMVLVMTMVKDDDYDDVSDDDAGDDAGDCGGDDKNDGDAVDDYGIASDTADDFEDRGMLSIASIKITHICFS